MGFDITGTWKNQYGSTMQLMIVPSSGLVYGIYASSTGSTGQYRVYGYYNQNAPANVGNAAGLTIYWHSIVAGPSDPSWHWVSGLGGQIVADGIGNTLILNHAMVATDPFPGLANTGTYIDKLTYTRISANAPDLVLPAEEGVLGDPIEGAWICDQDSTVQLNLQLAIPSAGVVKGTFQTSAGIFGAIGMTDTTAQGQINLQGLSIASLDNSGGVQVLSGSLNYGTNRLTLTSLYSQGTASNATYVETMIGTLTFHR